MADASVPSGHRLDDVNISAADNGFIVRHSTVKENPGKNESYDATHKDHKKVFENPEGAIRHVRKVLMRGSGKRFKAGDRAGARR